jgi:hypothetical protein
MIAALLLTGATLFIVESVMLIDGDIMFVILLEDQGDGDRIG